MKVNSDKGPDVRVILENLVNKTLFWLKKAVLHNPLGILKVMRI